MTGPSAHPLAAIARLYVRQGRTVDWIADELGVPADVVDVWTSGVTPETPHGGVKDALTHLDGTPRSAVRLLTGHTDEQLDELGGLPD